MFLQVQIKEMGKLEYYRLINTKTIDDIAEGEGGTVLRLYGGRKLEIANSFDEIFSALREMELIVQPGR